MQRFILSTFLKCSTTAINKEKNLNVKVYFKWYRNKKTNTIVRVLIYNYIIVKPIDQPIYKYTYRL